METTLETSANPSAQARLPEVLAGAGAALMTVAAVIGLAFGIEDLTEGVEAAAFASLFAAPAVYAFGVPVALLLERWTAQRRGVRLLAYAVAGTLGGLGLALLFAEPTRNSVVAERLLFWSTWFGPLGGVAAVLGAAVAAICRRRRRLALVLALGLPLAVMAVLLSALAPL